MCTIMEDDYEVRVICNPNTRHYVCLPTLTWCKDSDSYLGFDPIEKQFKVLVMAYPYSYFCEENDYRVLTLRRRKIRWRKIKCPLSHLPCPCSSGTCINGVVYYLAHEDGETPYEESQTYEIICFDVRSEKFNFLNVKCSVSLNTKLIN